MKKEVRCLIVRDDHGQDGYYTVGSSGVLEIQEHQARGEGDKWFYDVIYENKTERIFNPESVTLDHIPE